MATSTLSLIVLRLQPFCWTGSPGILSRQRQRIVVLIIVILAVTTMILAGYEVATAISATLATGVVAAEIASRLLGPAPCIA